MNRRRSILTVAGGRCRSSVQASRSSPVALSFRRRTRIGVWPIKSDMLEMDLESIQKQAAVNDEFLKKVGDDPTLAERLAQRQMKVVRAGSRVIRIGDSAPAGMSPFQLVNVPRPTPLPPYRPVGGVLASLCYQPHSRLYLTGIALFMLAAGIVLGLGETNRSD